jgi:hypothetical protein
MYFSDTTGILVADRRGAREGAANRHRSLRDRFRRADSHSLPAPARLHRSTARTTVGHASQAA